MKNLGLIFIFIMLLLGAFVFTTAIRIEILNAQAGYYLPRQDRQPDGTFADGKWRVSLENAPRDQLRRVVQTYGIMQYVMAPLLFAVAALVALKSKIIWARILGATGVFVGVIAAWLMFYREYWSSLGT
jgi:hypothetical protein